MVDDVNPSRLVCPDVALIGDTLFVRLSNEPREMLYDRAVRTTYKCVRCQVDTVTTYQSINMWTDVWDKYVISYYTLSESEQHTVWEAIFKYG